MRGILRRFWVLIALAVALAALLLAASVNLVVARIQAEVPEQQAREWVDAVLAAHTDEVAARTCSSLRGTVEPTALLLTGLAILGGRALSGPTPDLRFSDLAYRTLEHDKSKAVVQLSGQAQLTLGAVQHSQNFTVDLKMVSEDEHWRFCGIEA